MRTILILVLALGGLAAAQTQLTFYYPVGVAGPLARYIETYVDEFEAEHPDIRVNTVFGGNYTENQAKVITAIRSGNPPDVAVLLSQELNTLLSLEAVDPLDEVIAADPEAQAMMDDFFPGFMSNSILAGQTWSVPFQRSTPVLYYNIEAFEEAGLDPDSPPETWDELVEYAQQLTLRDDSGRVTRWGVAIPTEDRSTWLLEGLIMQAGGLLYDPAAEGRVATIDTQPVRDAIQFKADLAQVHGVSPEGVISWGTASNDFAAGSVAMLYHSTGSLGFIRNNADFEFATAFLPRHVEYGVPTGGGNLYLIRGADPEKRDAAWTFIKWMTSPEMAARWSIDSGYVATRESAWDLPVMEEYTSEYPQALTARDQLQYARAELPVFALQEIKDIVARAEQDVILGRATAEEATARAQQEADQVLEAFAE